MADNDIRLKGQLRSTKDDTGGAGLIPSAVIGIVKNNMDPGRSGKIEVYLVRGNSPEQDNPVYWVPVRYMSPFFGYTTNESSADDEGKFAGNPHSYGFWATPPDIGTEVICIFLNGDPSQGFYVGCIPRAGLTQMVPAIGSDTRPSVNQGEAESYGGATKLPVTEYNNANKNKDLNPALSTQYRPVHSYQAAILNRQGLIRDPDRGTISSSANRESPSRVFGMSTPGRPIYQGGYDDRSIGDAIANDSTPNENFKITGRRGGHTLVMDDGDIYGKDQLMRFRTGTGHMIMMNDAAELITIIHANGQSYIELGKEGTIDMYSTNSVNIRTMGDLNLHADRNININAAKDLNLSAENVKIESLKETTNYVGTNYKGYTKGDHTVRVESKIAIASAGDMGLKSKGTVYVNGGPDVKLNSGEMSLNPEEVKQLPIVAHTDTLEDAKKGYVPAPGKLSSITSRAPAHMPWAHAGQGTDAKADLKSSSNFPSSPTPAASAVNNASTVLNTKSLTSSSMSATVPNIGAISDSIGKGASSSLVSQMALTAVAGPFGPALVQGAGVLTSGQGIKTAALGSLALNPTQLEQAGLLKPGASVVANAGIQNGKSIAEAMPSNLFTGKDGIKNVNQYLSNPMAQSKSGIDLLKSSEMGLKATGVITGGENASQVGGLLMSAASLGVGPTMSYVNSFKQGAALPGSLTGLATQLTNMVPGSPKDLIASGNFAAGLSEKSMTALSGVKLGGFDAADKLKGIAAGVFGTMTAALKPLTKGPQNLTVVKEENTPASTTPSDIKSQIMKSELSASSPGGVNEKLTSLFGVGPGGSLRASAIDAGNVMKNATAGATSPEDAMSKSVTAISGLGEKLAPSLTGLFGGLSSISSVTSGFGDKPSIPGTGDIKDAFKSISGSISGGNLSSSVDGLKSKLNGGGLEALASTGLDPADASKLAGQLNAVGSGGQVDVKLPTVSTDTFDFSSLMEQSKSLLGDDKVPGLNFGSLPPGSFKVPTAEQSKKYDTLKKELDTENDNYFTTRKNFYDAKTKFGVDSSQAKSAEDAFKASMQKQETLRQQIADLSKA